MDRRRAGSLAEDIAMQFLQDLGYIILKRNFTFGRIGEIDIICESEGIIIFIEVKARMNHAFGPPESSITMKKIMSIKRVAEGYLYVNKIQNKQCRFDLIAIDFCDGKEQINHLLNAM